MSRKLKGLVSFAVLLLFLGASTIGTAWAMPSTQGNLQIALADIAVTKTASPSPVQVGSNLTYSINVANNGPASATGVTLTDTIVGGFTFMSATPNQGTCSFASNIVSCALGSLANGASATVAVVVTPTLSGSLVDIAIAQAMENDPNPANNVATLNTTVSSTSGADLMITKTASPSLVLLGNNVTYTVSVTDQGPSAATNVTMTDTLPTGVTFASATPSQGTCSQTSGVVTCNLGGLANSVSAAITIVVTPTAAGVISNSASVTATEADANAANNTASASVTVNGADLSIKKSDFPDPVVLGSNLTYTLNIMNHGPAAATGVTVTDNLPAGVTFVSATPSQGTCSQASGTVTCNLGNLANGAGATVTIIVTPTAAGVISNTGSVAANETDPNTGNNKSIEKSRVVTTQPEATRTKIEFTGIVQSLPVGGLIGIWKVQGLTVNVTEATKIKGTPQVGSFVKGDGTLMSDGSVQARDLKVKEAENKKHDDERPGYGKGDKNHKHTGPRGKDGDD